MRIAYPTQISERETDLLALEKQLRGQPTAARVQMLRLLKSGAVGSLTACVPVLGYSRSQLQRWWAAYRDGGLTALLQRRTAPGKRARLTPAAWAGLQAELQAGRIARLADAQRYLKDQWGIDYQSVNGIWWHFKHRRIRLKTGRRQHRQHDAQAAEQFKKTSPGH